MPQDTQDDRMQVKLVHDGSDHIARWVDGGGLPFPLEIQAFDEHSPRAALDKLADALAGLGIPCSVDAFLVTDESAAEISPDFVGHYRDPDGTARALCQPHAEDFGEDLEELQPFAGAVCERSPKDAPGRLLSDGERASATGLPPRLDPADRRGDVPRC